MKTYNTMWHHHGGGHGPPLHQLMREHTRKEEQEEKTAGEDRQGLCRVSVPMGQPPWPDTVGSDWPQKAPGAGQSQVPQPHWRCLWKNVFKKRWRASLAERSERGKKVWKTAGPGLQGEQRLSWYQSWGFPVVPGRNRLELVDGCTLNISEYGPHGIKGLFQPKWFYDSISPPAYKALFWLKQKESVKINNNILSRKLYTLECIKNG